MKATDYVEKYYDALLEEAKKGDESKVLRDIILDFFYETKDIASKRQIKTISAFHSLEKEQNQKYNKFCRLINEKMGQQFLLENGLQHMFEN